MQTPIVKGIIMEKNRVYVVLDTESFKAFGKSYSCNHPEVGDHQFWVGDAGGETGDWFASMKTDGLFRIPLDSVEELPIEEYSNAELAEAIRTCNIVISWHDFFKDFVNPFYGSDLTQEDLKYPLIEKKVNDCWNRGAYAKTFTRNRMRELYGKYAKNPMPCKFDITLMLKNNFTKEILQYPAGSIMWHSPTNPCDSDVLPGGCDATYFKKTNKVTDVGGLIYEEV